MVKITLKKPSTYSKKEEEIFEIYSRFRLDGLSKQESLINLILMEYKITPKILDTIRTYDRHIFWKFY